VPYALKAGDAETLGGKPVSAFMEAPQASVVHGKTAPPPGTITGTGTANYIPIFTGSTTIADSLIYQTAGGSVGINNLSPSATLDVGGMENIRDTLTLFPKSTDATLAVSGTNFNISSTGKVTFISGQTFPGTGTIKGVTAGTDLTGGGTSGIVTLNVDTTKVVTGVTAGTDLTGGGQGGSLTLNVDTTKVPQLATSNTFNGNQTVNGTISAASFSGSGSGITNLLGSNVQGTVATATNALELGGLPPVAYQSAGSYATTTGNNTFTGTQTVNGILALPSTTGSTNGVIALGGQSFLHNYGTGDTFVGANAGNFSTTGSQNTAIGFQSLASDTLGASNTATGYATLTLNTTGAANTATGNQALNANTTGGVNTAMGWESLESNTSGNNNTAIGVLALSANSTDGSNTAIGAYAGLSLVSGSGNTFIGALTNTGVQTSISNATAIGEFATVNESNAIVLGSISGVNGAPTSVKVGIGTTTPSNVFTIGQGSGQAISDGWINYSSRRWKTNVQTLHGALRKVEQLRGVSYDLKANGKHEVGVIAEEVGVVVPEVVTWEKNGEDAQGVDYSRLTALLIEATKEQQKLIREQQAQIRSQTAQIAQLATQVRVIRTALKERGWDDSKARTIKARVSSLH
jgi:hypothetical protein